MYLLTPKEIAYELGCTPNTVLNEIKRGNLKGIFLSKRVVRILSKDFNKYLVNKKAN